MKAVRTVSAVVLSIAVILCMLSMSSFASFMPFSSDKKDSVQFTDLNSETQSERFSEGISTLSEDTEPASVVDVPEESEAAEMSLCGTATAVPECSEESITAPSAESYGVCTEPGTTVTTAENDTADTEAEPSGESPESTAEPETAAAPDKIKISSYAAVKSVAATPAATETYIALNRDVNGVLASVDSVNTYTFTVTERGVLQYSLTHQPTEPDGIWRVALYQRYNSNGYDGEEKWRLINVLETTASRTVDKSPNTGLQKGVYRLTVSSGAAFSPAAYTLKAAFTPGNSYEIEYNDTMARYTEIYPGTAVKGSANLRSGEYDNDYYMFRVHEKGKVTLKFEHTKIDSVSVYWRVALFDAAGNELYADNSLSTVSCLSSGEIGLEPGCYFVGIFGRVHTDFDYTLTVTRENDSAFETENNSSAEKADILPLNGSISGALTSSSGDADVDMFALTVPQPGYAKLTFRVPEGTEEDPGWRVTLRDAAGRNIWESRLSQKNNLAVSAPLGLGQGTYYVVVDNYTMTKNSASYTVSSEFTPSAGWEREYNDGVALATPITKNIGVSGTIVDCEAEFDDDYYVFTLTSPAVVKMTLTHDALSGEKNIFSVSLLNADQSAVQLFDETSGKPLTDKNGAAVMSFKSAENTANAYGSFALSAGTYYIRVTSGLFSSDVRYLLTITY